jgi:hypothetical protein
MLKNWFLFRKWKSITPRVAAAHMRDHLLTRGLPSLLV